MATLNPESNIYDLINLLSYVEKEYDKIKANINIYESIKQYNYFGSIVLPKFSSNITLEFNEISLNKIDSILLEEFFVLKEDISNYMSIIYSVDDIFNKDIKIELSSDTSDNSLLNTNTLKNINSKITKDVFAFNKIAYSEDVMTKIDQYLTNDYFLLPLIKINEMCLKKDSILEITNILEWNIFIKNLEITTKMGTGLITVKNKDFKTNTSVDNIEVNEFLNTLTEEELDKRFFNTKTDMYVQANDIKKIERTNLASFRDVKENSSKFIYDKLNLIIDGEQDTNELTKSFDEFISNENGELMFNDGNYFVSDDKVEEVALYIASNLI